MRSGPRLVTAAMRICAIDDDHTANGSTTGIRRRTVTK
jgi:hypothetical protein